MPLRFTFLRLFFLGVKTCENEVKSVLILFVCKIMMVFVLMLVYENNALNNRHYYTFVYISNGILNVFGKFVYH